MILETYSLSKLLNIRQALGQAAISVQPTDVAATRLSAIRALFVILRLLLPNNLEEKLQNFSTKIMDKSIALRTAMTEEQAIYRCYFYDHGESFDGEWVEIASGEKPVGKITMCTFPGLRRLTMNEGKKQFMPIVKATAKLDTAS